MIRLNQFLVLVALNGLAYALTAVVAPLVLTSLATSTRKVSRMARHRRFFLGFAIVAVLGGPAFARPSAPGALDADLDALISPDGFTADDATKRSRAASPEVARKLAELDEAIANVDAARVAWIPQLSSKLTYTRLSKVDIPELAPGIELTLLENSYAADGQLVVPLSDYVLRTPALNRSAKLGASAARAAVRASVHDAATEARLAYYEWVRARLQILVAERQLAQVRATATQVRQLVSGDRLSKADLLRVESQQAQAEQTLDRMRTISTLREEQLRLHIGASAAEHLTIGEDIRAAVQVPASTAAPRRDDMAALNLAIEAAEERRSAEAASKYPRLSAFATTEYANPNSRALIQDDSFTSSWTAGAQLTFSLSESLTARANDRKLRAETAQLRADRDALARATHLELVAAQQNVSNAQKAIATSQTRLAAAEEGYRVRKAFLDAERGTAVELVDAETELTSSRIAALDAHIDLRIALTELGHALGAH